jgi:hypothetical protein
MGTFMRLSQLSGLLAPLTAVALLGCGGDNLVLPTEETPSSRRPTTLEIASGNDQVGNAAAALPQQVVVKVVDQDGLGLAGQTVSWSVTTGAGIASPSSVTDSGGFAGATWILGNPGPNTLAATVSGLGSVVFIAMANGGGDDGAGDGEGDDDGDGDGDGGGEGDGGDGGSGDDEDDGNGGGGDNGGEDSGPGEPDRFIFRIQPRDVRVGEWFTVEVAIVDGSGNVVPLDGTEIYLGLWKQDDRNPPANDHLAGDRFEDTVDGVATFNLYVKSEGRYQLKARSDYLPQQLGPYGPELFSTIFDVN